MAEHGLLTEVRSTWDGTETTADAAAGASTLSLLAAEELAVADRIWLDGVESHVITAIDYDVNTITVDPVLAADYEAATPVVPDQGGAPAEVWVAEVLLPDHAEPIEVSMDYRDRLILTEGVLDPPRPIQITDDLSAIEDFPGQVIPVPRGAYEPPDSGDLVPTVAPTSSPVIDHISATITALGVVTEPVDLFTSIAYHISTTDGFVPATWDDAATLVLDTESTLGVLDHLADNSALQLATPYYVRTWAHNDIGPAPAPSAQMSGQLNKDNVDTVFTQNLEAGFVLAGTITVGQITISTEEGIEVGEGGALAHIPADGTDIELTAAVDAVRLNVRDELTISGQGTLYGDLALNAGIVAPTVGPTLTGRWVTVSPTGVGFISGDISFYTAGLVVKHGDNTQLAYTQRRLSITYTDIEFLNIDDGTDGGALARGSAWGSSFYAYGGLAYSSNPGDGTASYYVLGEDAARDFDWYIYRINATTGVKISERRFGSMTYFPANPALYLYSAGVVGVVYSNPNFRIRYVNGTTLADAGGPNTILTNTYGNLDIGDAFYGDAGTGTDRLYLAVKSSHYPSVLAFDLSSGRTPTLDFVRGSTYIGMTYDAAAGQMLAVSSTSTLYRHGKYATAKTIHGKHAWYDADATGGTHETLCGPETVLTLGARQYLQVATAAPPDAADGDANHHDRANEVKVYVENVTDANGTWYAATLTAEPWTAWKPIITEWTNDTPDSGTAFPASEFPGIIESDAVRTSSDALSKTYLDGTGLIRADGLIPPGTIIMWGGDTQAPPTFTVPGWLFCNGYSALRADYPALFAAIGTRFGSADGTHFNLPNFVTRFPLGDGTPGGTGGSSTLPDHTHYAGTYATSGTSLGQQSNTSSVDGARNRLTAPDTHDHDVNGESGVPVGSNPSIMPPYLEVGFLIRAV